MKGLTTLLSLCMLLCSAAAFSVLPASPAASSATMRSSNINTPTISRAFNTKLYMSDKQRSSTTKKGTVVIDKIQQQEEQEDVPETMWRVVLHNDEVHTFNYVVRSLTKIIGTLDRKAAFEICVQTHGIGKATITKTWKKQAEQFCLGLQRQGLTVSISPDEDFDGGHSGGGL